MLTSHVTSKPLPVLLCLNGLILTDLFVSISHLLISSKLSLTLPSPPRQAGFPAPLAMPCNSPAPNDHRVSPFSSLPRWLALGGQGHHSVQQLPPQTRQQAWEGPGQEVLGGTRQEAWEGGTGREVLGGRDRAVYFSSCLSVVFLQSNTVETFW